MNEEKWELLDEEMIFDINEHLIWKIEELEENIETPEGYKEIKKDKISYLRKIYIRKFFVNVTPVKAKLYKNKTTKEISYYFEGTPITKQKVFERRK
ncbi:MAG: hypothetical protein IKF91_01950 [Bacilli bacterium]|nr:hypothetical protein [Bacilli bacterium]